MPSRSLEWTVGELAMEQDNTSVKLLVVDEDRKVRENIAAYLKERDYEVLQAAAVGRGGDSEQAVRD